MNDIPKVYYKVKNSDKIHILGFEKDKVFDMEELEKGIYKIKSNITYIHFYKCFGELMAFSPIKIVESLDTEIVFTLGHKEDYHFEIYGKNIIFKTFNKDSDEDIFNATIKGAKIVRYWKKHDIFVKDATETIFMGNLRTDSLTIYSKYLEINDSSSEINNLNSDIYNFIHYGNKLVLNNINCAMLDFKTTALDINVHNSSIKSFRCSFLKCARPNLVNSRWKVQLPLEYLKDIIGNRKRGITITDETFSNDSCLDLSRAYLTYKLQEVLETINDDKKREFELKSEVIDGKIRELREKCENEIALLNEKKQKINQELNHQKLKNLIKIRDY